MVRRTTALLRTVSNETGTGVSTTELARRADIPQATAHLLESLATEGYTRCPHRRSVHDHSANVLAIAQVLVALVDVLQAVFGGHQLIEL